MRRRNRRNNDLLIDLTSILDVVFIVLLVVICNQQLASKDYAKAESDSVTAQEEANETKMLYEQQLEVLNDFQEYVISIAVNARYDSKTVTKRHITVLTNDEELEKYELLGANVSDVLNKFENYLEDIVKLNEGKPVLLSLNADDEKILYRDEKAINEIFMKLCERYDNVYITKAGTE